MRSAISATVEELRPDLWPFIWAHSLTGFLIVERSSVFQAGIETVCRGLLAGGIWAVCLGGAAAGLWGYFGREPRRASGWTALVLLTAGLAFSPVIAWRYFDAFLVGVILLVAACVPPSRVARFEGVGPILESSGFGALTFYAGAAVVLDASRPVPGLVVYMFGFMLLVVAAFVLASEAESHIMPFLFATAAGGGFACLWLAGDIEAAGWRALLALAALPLWATYGIRRYRAGGRPARPGHALGLLLLADISLWASTFAQ